MLIKWGWKTYSKFIYKVRLANKNIAPKYVYFSLNFARWIISSNYTHTNTHTYIYIYIYIHIYIYIYIDTDTTIGWLAIKYNRWGTFLFLIIFSQNLYNYILKSMSLHRLYNIYPNLRNIRYTLFGVTQWSNDLFSCKSSTVRWQSPNGNEVYMTPNGPG